VTTETYFQAVPKEYWDSLAYSPRSRTAMDTDKHVLVCGSIDSKSYFIDIDLQLAIPVHLQRVVKERIGYGKA